MPPSVVPIGRRHPSSRSNRGGGAETRARTHCTVHPGSCGSRIDLTLSSGESCLWEDGEDDHTKKGRRPSWFCVPNLHQKLKNADGGSMIHLWICIFSPTHIQHHKDLIKYYWWSYPKDEPSYVECMVAERRHGREGNQNGSYALLVEIESSAYTYRSF